MGDMYSRKEGRYVINVKFSATVNKRLATIYPTRRAPPMTLLSPLSINACCSIRVPGENRTKNNGTN